MRVLDAGLGGRESSLGPIVRAAPEMSWLVFWSTVGGAFEAVTSLPCVRSVVLCCLVLGRFWGGELRPVDSEGFRG